MSHEFGLVGSLDGKRESLAKFAIEALSDVAGEFEVLKLVFANGDVNGIVKQDVCSHEDGIIKDADINIVALARGFFFPLDHATHFAHGSDGVKDPTKLAVSGYVGLAVDMNIVVQF